MHHFIYPSKDTFVTNRSGLVGKNFGVDEIIQIGTQNVPQRILSPTRDYVYTNIIFNDQGFTSFTGIFTGSLEGNVVTANGRISGSNLSFSSSYFSGSVNGAAISVISGSVSGSFVFGTITGSIISEDFIGQFIGQLTSSNVCLIGTGSGIDTRNEQTWTTATTKFVDRSLLGFDITAISQSIVDGTIASPQFNLKVKVCSEYDLPITYTIYALPISQSWDMGDGYLSDGGSDTGVNWTFRDDNYGTPWYTSSIAGPRPAIDFINNLSKASASFGYGGGTWYTSSYCSQSFNYKSGDIDMNITPIVMAWISGSIPNQGIILVSSDELQSTGSGFILKFFSRDTNTIYSPYLDVGWDDAIYNTGSFFTSSVTISNASAGITASVQSGSSLVISGGTEGIFSGSAVLYFTENYITASNQIFNYSAPGNVLTNNTWYANNGYHYDSWQTSWDLDPYSGGFLPHTDITATIVPDFGSPPVFKFTGSFSGSFSGTASYVQGSISGSGEFSASYFTGSIDGINFELSASSVSGSLITGSISGSVESIAQLGIFNGQLTSSLIYLNGTGSGYFLDSTYESFGGFVVGKGLDGHILGIPVFGDVQGFASLSQSLVTGSCGKNFSASLAKAIFLNGPFSSSTFTAYYVDHKFENAHLTGSWTEEALLGARVLITLPSNISRFAYANVSGVYVSGLALGVYTISGSNGSPLTGSPGSNSASFNGAFIDGNLEGAYINFQLSGSIYTSSFAYTSSVVITSSFLSPLNVGNPFSINLQNVQPTYKVGDIVKFNVFGRKKFPLKYFGKATQQEQYLIPEFLPTSSYYAIKDDQTEEMVLDFDDFTKIGCQYPEGNYFIIDTTGLAQERYYRVLIRIDDSTSTYTIDTGKTFKIVR